MNQAAGNTFATFWHWTRRVLMTLLVVLAVAAAGLAWLWHDRASLEAIDWPPYPPIEPSLDAVTMTWFGVSTVLFDDGETQILIDGFFSRPTLLDALLGRPVSSDAATINFVLDDYRMRRLAAIIPTQSHYDHAMDIGALANRSSASILGSESSANIARGSGVREDQVIVAIDGGQYRFGRFSVTMIESPHAPVGWAGSVPVAGTIDEPLEAPAPIWSYREGRSYTVIVDHPYGTTLIQSSGGFVDQQLSGIHADVVLLGVGMLEVLGRNYAETYWQSVVTTTGARDVFLVHFDDFTRPFGEIRLYPRVLDDLVKTSGWFEAFRDKWDSDTRLHLPEFGKTLVLYSGADPEA